jgi:hypothetical protein
MQFSSWVDMLGSCVDGPNIKYHSNQNAFLLFVSDCYNFTPENDCLSINHVYIKFVE